MGSARADHCADPVVQAMGLAAVLGMALAISVAHGLARQDRQRLDALMSGIEAE